MLELDTGWLIAALGALAAAWAWLRRRRARARVTLESRSGHFHLSMRARSFSEPPTGKRKGLPSRSSDEDE